MFLIVSCSLNPNSRSRITAEYAGELLKQKEIEFEFLDLALTPLPLCDAGSCYGDPNVQQAQQLVKNAKGILVACPIYNFNINSAAKNLIELTGQNWRETVVGFICAAGGHSSYASVMGIANSLMLDFRSFIVPRFVYTTGDDFEDDSLASDEIRSRVSLLVDDWVRVTRCLSKDD